MPRPPASGRPRVPLRIGVVLCLVALAGLAICLPMARPIRDLQALDSAGVTTVSLDAATTYGLWGYSTVDCTVTGPNGDGVVVLPPSEETPVADHRILGVIEAEATGDHTFTCSGHEKQEVSVGRLTDLRIVDCGWWGAITATCMGLVGLPLATFGGIWHFIDNRRARSNRRGPAATTRGIIRE
ncbi:hypothetical protein [Actinomyces glycerinitolerans]|uniref:Uncharacterized protein n=1 Tax=Actinomyces glycerinitolerans TaxID=1892869 RepID=A0A1M4RXL4_9ACTO|nr:hypothetical protein [Actinomyces glycerinitolerans]SHE24640.1 Hypothetical protein ACGLYG10_0848 [Actinomyces glycerinitolerans]